MHGITVLHESMAQMDTTTYWGLIGSSRLSSKPTFGACSTHEQDRVPQVGDAVAVEPGVPCACSQQTLAGRYNLDPGVKFLATPPVHGALAKVIAKLTFSAACS